MEGVYFSTIDKLPQHAIFVEGADLNLSHVPMPTNAFPFMFRELVGQG